MQGGWGDGLPFGFPESWPPGAWGDGLPLGFPSPAEWIAEILIGDQVVWSSAESSSQREIQIDVSGFTGVQQLKFRLRRTE